ncbi:uncharacterized protein LOC124289861 [Haliotis rubra]|uniref:uncharacterized protein LOC124289861 n=1 Tax=Haliotis rubra TaxID=36100 RepID=UPI001EE5EAA9|nr:uncharacterized protein LOC124289861 [Haliotis rubra]
MTVYLPGTVFAGILGGLFFISCVLSAVKACRDRKKIKERIAAHRAAAVACSLTTSTSAASLSRPRSASQYGDLAAPEIFNYRRSSFGSNVIVRTLGDDAYDFYAAASTHPSVVSNDYMVHPPDYARVHGRRHHDNPMPDARYYQRRRSYENAMDNPAVFYFPPQSQRRLTEPNANYFKGGVPGLYEVPRGGREGRQIYFHEMNGSRGTENRAFDNVEESHQL